MDTPEDTKTVVNYFKWEGHKYTARYLISICGIEIDKVKEYQKFKIKIPKYVSNIEKYDMTLFLLILLNLIIHLTKISNILKLIMINYIKCIVNIVIKLIL